MRDDEFMVGSWSNRPRIGIDASAVRRIFLCFWSAILRGRRSIWSGWREMPVAPRIVNDVAYVTKINHESFCVAGAVFGDVGGRCLLLRAL